MIHIIKLSSIQNDNTLISIFILYIKLLSIPLWRQDFALVAMSLDSGYDYGAIL